MVKIMVETMVEIMVHIMTEVEINVEIEIANCTIDDPVSPQILTIVVVITLGSSSLSLIG